MNTISSDEARSGQTSRRVFLGWISVGSAAGVAAGCQSRDRATMPGPTGAPGPSHDHDDAPGPAPEGGVHANRDALQFFNHHQAMTVDAVNARIIPGTDDDPCASQAAVVFYIDHLLATHTGSPTRRTWRARSPRPTTVRSHRRRTG